MPKLRFKADDGSEFPEWEEKKIGELGTVVTGSTPPTKDKDNYGGEFLWVTPTDISDSPFIFDTKRKLTNTGRAKARLLPKNTVLITCIASIGKNCILPREGSCNQQINAIIPFPSINSYYLLNAISFKKPELEALGGNGGMKIISKSLFEGFSILIPSLPEQQKIASFLTTIDDIIAKSRAEVEAWEKRKKGVIKKLFSQEVRFKADDGSEFPEWEEKKIGELGEFIKGAPLSKSDISDTGTPFILYGELYTTYNEVACNIIRKTKAIVDEKHYSKPGDVLIPTSGESAEEISTATCVMVPGVILAGDLNIFRSNILDGRIMSYILNYQSKWKIASIAQGKSIVHIQSKQLSEIKIKYPASKDEQQKIADCLSSLDEVIKKCKKELAAWEELKKGLLQQMFI